MLLGWAFSGTCVHAQRRGGWSAPPRVTPSFARGVGFARYPHHAFNPGLFYAWDPFFYADDSYGPPPTQAPPQVILVESRPSADSQPEAKPEPLLIEWQGDHYVRYESGEQPEQTVSAPLDYAQGTAPRPQGTATDRPAELPPAVLVYRDGHQEKVSDYSIISGILYARGNYWRDGYWTRNIEISSLNIPATMKASQENGVSFVLPSGPNEVVTRP